MKKIAIAIVIGLVVLGIGSAMAGSQPGSTRDNPPPLPAFIDQETGQVNLPEWIPVSGGGWIRGADMRPGIVAPVYDRPGGKVIGQISQGEGK